MEAKKGFFLLATAKAKQIRRDLPLDASRGGFVMKSAIQKKGEGWGFRASIGDKKGSFSFPSPLSLGLGGGEGDTRKEKKPPLRSFFLVSPPPYNVPAGQLAEGFTQMMAPRWEGGGVEGGNDSLTNKQSQPEKEFANFPRVQSSHFRKTQNIVMIGACSNVCFNLQKLCLAVVVGEFKSFGNTATAGAKNEVFYVSLERRY